MILLNQIISRYRTFSGINIDMEFQDECIIFGSGPSLDLLNGNSPFLDDKDLIGCNYIHQNNNLLGKRFKFYSMIDRDYTRSLNDSYFENLHCCKFILATKNAYLAPLKVLARKNLLILRTHPFDQYMDSSLNIFIDNGVFVNGNSMPFLIQVAALLGKYKRIFLYGVDHYDIEGFDDYKNFDGYKGRIVKKATITPTKLEYINNFYRAVKSLTDALNVEIINVTPRSKLAIFSQHEIYSLTKPNS